MTELTESTMRTPQPPSSADDQRDGQPGAVGPVQRVRAALRTFRQTRPFWGGLLLLLAGADIVYFAGYPVRFAVSDGWNSSAGYILGGGLIIFGLASWFAQLYAPLLGLLGVGVALVAFISTNLGGLLIGTVLGIIGGSMVWAWGEKKPRTVDDTDGSDR